jgi:delta 1-pyrroline-5-carboxylate dehydrogenase
MKITKTLTAIAFGAICSTAAVAQPYGGQGGYGGGRGAGGLERQDAINMQRIERGERTGQLTSRESARLRERQANIERMEADARRDGRITRDERTRIQIAQDDLSRAITRRKTNDRERYPNDQARY